MKTIKIIIITVVLILALDGLMNMAGYKNNIQEILQTEDYVQKKETAYLSTFLKKSREKVYVLMEEYQKLHLAYESLGENNNCFRTKKKNSCENIIPYLKLIIDNRLEHYSTTLAVSREIENIFKKYSHMMRESDLNRLKGWSRLLKKESDVIWKAYLDNQQAYSKAIDIIRHKNAMTI